jgi:hypothetical protein
MAKVERIKGKVGRPEGVKARIAKMTEKYGDVVTLIHDVDRKPGSPSLFKPDNNRIVFWLALAGMTEYEMANIFGITDAGFAMWKKNRPDFLKALQSGRMEAVGVAAHSLFKVATGYSHEAVKLIPNRIKVYNPDTGKVVREYTEVIEHPYTKHYPPNVTALLRFLAAKYPEVWGEKSEVRHTGEVVHSVDASKLTKKQLKTLRAIAQSGHQKEEKSAKKADKSANNEEDDE